MASAWARVQEEEEEEQEEEEQEDEEQEEIEDGCRRVHTWTDSGQSAATGADSMSLKKIRPGHRTSYLKGSEKAVRHTGKGGEQALKCLKGSETHKQMR